MNDLMADIETFGNGKDKCIVQIGACYFDRVTGEIGATFKRNIDARSHMKYGAQIDADTVYWWLSQSPEAIASVIAEPREDIKVVMSDLNEFLKDAKAIWSHLGFDFVTLSETLKQLDIKPLFSFRAARDIRTLVDLGKVSTSDFNATRVLHHDSLDDCFTQVRYCVAALNKVSGRVEVNKRLKELEREVQRLKEYEWRYNELQK